VSGSGEFTPVPFPKAENGGGPHGRTCIESDTTPICFSITDDIPEDFLGRQHEAEKEGLRLLKRKNEKMEMWQVLMGDIKRFADER